MKKLISLVLTIIITSSLFAQAHIASDGLVGNAAECQKLAERLERVNNLIELTKQVYEPNDPALIPILLLHETTRDEIQRKLSSLCSSSDITDEVDNEISLPEVNPTPSDSEEI